MLRMIQDNLHISRKTLETVLTVCTVLVLILTAAVTVQGKFTFFAVTRGVSMQPVFVTNDLILFPPYSLTRQIRPAQVGDIIVYRAPAVPPVWAHRIIEETSPGVYRTKGDNNPHPDSFDVRDEDILGIVPHLGTNPLSVPYVGLLLLKWQSNTTLRWGTLFLLLMLMVASPSEGRRRRPRRPSGQGWLLRRLAVATGCALFLFVFTLYPFLSRSGYASVGYRVAEGEGIAYGGAASVNFGIVKQGDTRVEERTVSNGGLIPMVVLMQVPADPLNEVSISPTFTVLPPRSSETIEFRVDARSVGEWRKLPVTMTTVPYLLPAACLAFLASFHPMVPNLVISGSISLLLACFAFIYMGRYPRRAPMLRRRRMGIPLLKEIGGAVLVGGLLVTGFVLPSLLASTGMLLELPVATSVITAQHDEATLAWQPAQPVVGAGEVQTINLFDIDNYYALDIWVETDVNRNDGGILSDWESSEWLGPSTGVGWNGTLDATGGLSPGVYRLEFHVKAFTAGGELVADWDVPVDVQVTPAELAPPPEGGE